MLLSVKSYLTNINLPRGLGLLMPNCKSKKQLIGEESPLSNLRHKLRITECSSNSIETRTMVLRHRQRRVLYTKNKTIELMNSYTRKNTKE
jgi:hypothetical protein